MKQIVINIPISWTASEAKCVKGVENERIYKYTTGNILDVVPDLGPDDEYKEGTVPESRAKGMCQHDLAAEYTPEAMRASQARLKDKQERIAKARAKLEEDDG